MDMAIFVSEGRPITILTHVVIGRLGDDPHLRLGANQSCAIKRRHLVILLAG
jgi:hypothetical protein